MFTFLSSVWIWQLALMLNPLLIWLLSLTGLLYWFLVSNAIYGWKRRLFVIMDAFVWSLHFLHSFEVSFFNVRSKALIQFSIFVVILSLHADFAINRIWYISIDCPFPLIVTAQLFLYLLIGRIIVANLTNGSIILLLIFFLDKSFNQLLSSI